MVKKILTKYEILAAQDRPLVAMDVPEWGGTIFLKALSISRAMALRSKYMGLDGVPKPETGLSFVLDSIAACIVDESGQPLFSSDELEILGEKNPNVVNKVFQKIEEINGGGENSVEQAEKN